MKALYFDNNLTRIAALKAASLVTRKAVYAPFSPFRCGEVPEPRIPSPRWLKVKNRACGLCGSDIHFIFMEIDTGCFPAATPGLPRKYLGHEMLGEVEEAGGEVEGFRPGDRVSLRIDWPSCFQMEIDPPCRQCARGRYMLCENLGKKKLPLLDTGGGFSPHMVMHRSQPFRVPDALSDDEALLLEPLACAVHGVMKCVPEPGDTVLVVGAGTMGLLTLAAVRALQPAADVYCLARYGFQAEHAERLGARGVIYDNDHAYREIARITGARYLEGYFKNRILLGGFDAIFDTVGSDRSIHNSLRWARGGGTLVVLGINFMPGKIDYTPVWEQEVKVTGINCHAMEPAGESSFEAAARLLEEKRVSVDGLITHRLPLGRYREAIELFLSKGRSKAIKIVLEHR